MKIADISKIDELTIHASIVTIGFFDGVHLGHQAILQRQKIEKEKRGLQSVIITFNDDLIEKFKMKNILQSIKDKLKIFENFAVDYVLTIQSNSEILQLSAQEFVETILSKLHTKLVVAGSDFSFGHDRLGNAQFLRNYTNIEVMEISDVIVDNHKISSSYLRNLIENGKISQANQYLYQPFHLTSFVIHGKGLGRTLQFKTANLAYTPFMNVLKHGVYFGYALLNEKKYLAMINVGNNPTVSQDDKLKVEAFLLNFNQSIYDEELTLYFLTYHREEEKFSTKEKLKEQLLLDVQSLNRFFYE